MKKLFFAIFSLFLAFSIAGCGSSATPSASKPKVESAEDTATNILKMSSFQQWDQLYSYLHPDVQAKYTKEQFIEDRKKAGGIFANVKDYKVDKASIVESWTDKDGTGKTYQNAAEVPFILTFNGDKTLRGTIHLAKTNDGTWRYFWSPIKN